MEFTGDYYRCHNCGHIWDYIDLCPECGQDDQEEISINEVLSWSTFAIPEEAERIIKMLESHDDLKTK